MEGGGDNALGERPFAPSYQLAQYRFGGRLAIGDQALLILGRGRGGGGVER